MIKKKPKRIWQLVPEKKPKPKVPDTTKLLLTEEANKLIETVIKPRYIQPPPTDNDLNYLVDVYSKWYQNYFYLISRYNCPSPKALASSFELKYIRIEYVDENKYNLAYMRHTGQWYEIRQECPMLECLNMAIDYPP
jgi:hypothetical protein